MVTPEVVVKIIKDSKSKLSILELLKNDPDYLRAISKKIGIFPSAVLKHLEFLEENNLIISESVGKKKYFKLTKTGKNLLNSL